MEIKDKIIIAMGDMKKAVFTTKEIEDSVIKDFPDTNRNSILPADYCYNHENRGSSIHKFFLQIDHGKYEFVGEEYIFTGDTHKTVNIPIIQSRDSNIPEGITKENIFTAAQAYDDNSIQHEFKHSTTYDVIINGHRYPPKAIIGIASSYHLGKPLTPHHFSGGIQTKCFRVLKENSFKIVLKNDDIIYPDEVPKNVIHVEGKVVEVTVNSYERDDKARDACIDHYGLKCQVCNFDFEKQYGELGAGFIHVHHLVQLSEIKEEYIIDPIKDLRPVCPNCHAMLHKRKKIPYSINELKEKIKKTMK